MRPLIEWFRVAGLPDPAVDIPVSGFQADSRRMRPGQAFVAIPGTHVHGLDYADQAIANGASLILSDRTVEKAVPVLVVEPVRRTYALLCAAMYPRQPKYLVGVTGTNGKTSVAEFYRQLWALEGKASASIGTLGLLRADGAPDSAWPSENTSPAPDILHETLDRLSGEGVQHVAIEASSHGIDQSRLDGVRFQAAAFTNLSQDHLDYHGTMDAYFRAKARLFEAFDLTAYVNRDDAYGERLFQQLPGANGFGEQGEWLKLLRLDIEQTGLRFKVQYQGQCETIASPLYGDFQASNMLAAGCLALDAGMPWDRLIAHLPRLKGGRGRMEYVATHESGAPIFIDYAHTPDALKHLLTSLRAHTAEKLHLVFGCGGERDTSKRAQMGSIAAQYADRIIITDDNPRREDPELIRRQILSAAPNAHEVADRREAIAAAIGELSRGDCLVVAGKGHETYQIIGDQKQYFDDAHVIREALGTL